ncbi:MAG TPA: DUF309 domain-containing protein [Terriglobales bacterium]|nr:DUF309 domain-containing protein [Terriglobales bacterium]
MLSDETRAHLEHGIRLFNAGRYFDAHEALEDAWRSCSGDEKLLLQGVTQAAVALHHHSTGNLTGAQSVLARALANMSGFPEGSAGLRLAPLRASLSVCLAAIERSEPLPPRPHIERTTEASGT